MPIDLNPRIEELCGEISSRIVIRVANSFGLIA